MVNCNSREGDIYKFTISGGNDEGVPPVPIPNTEVKPFSAESTWLDTAREDRSLPEFIFLSSSLAEHSAVNRVVVGSSPTWGAENQAVAWFSFFVRGISFVRFSIAYMTECINRNYSLFVI